MKFTKPNGTIKICVTGIAVNTHSHNTASEVNEHKSTTPDDTDDCNTNDNNIFVVCFQVRDDGIGISYHNTWLLLLMLHSLFFLFPASVTITFPNLSFDLPIRKNSLVSSFVPFFQADRSSTRRFGGVGLGLVCNGRVLPYLSYHRLLSASY